MSSLIPSLSRRNIIERAIRRIATGRRLAAAQITELLPPDPSSRVGVVLDKLLQKVNRAALMDCYLGANWLAGGVNLRLYFSEFASEDDLNRLVQDIQGVAQHAELAESDEPEAKWMIATDRVAAGDPNIQGRSIPVDIHLSGDMAVEER